MPSSCSSHQGGIRGADGKPIALGYHVGHYELGLLMEAAAREFAALGCMPFAGYCTDPCDGRTQGTPGMMDSLAYRNEAAEYLPPADPQPAPDAKACSASRHATSRCRR